MAKLLKAKTGSSTSGFITTNKFGLRMGDFKKVTTELWREEMGRMVKAAKAVKSRIIDFIDFNGIGTVSGKLKKSIKYRRTNNAVFVGSTDPKAHLIELGTEERTVQNYMGKEGVTKAVGRMDPKPFVQPAFEDMKQDVKDIMAEPLDV